MPHGFFTIEQWTRRPKAVRSGWVAVAHLDASHSLADALTALESRGKAGFFRVVQMQRMVWAEKDKDGSLRLRKWHASSPKSLARSAKAFERDRGKWPAR